MSRKQKLTLSERERSVLDYIVAYKTEHDGISPVIRQIQVACRISSSNTVHHYLDRLEYLGYIIRYLGISRGIHVIGGQWTYAPPQRAQAAGGAPDEAGHAGADQHAPTGVHHPDGHGSDQC